VPPKTPADESHDSSSPYCVGEGGASRDEHRRTLVERPVTEIDCACFCALRLLIDIALSVKSFRSSPNLRCKETLPPH
jgi:hypothetical protein